MAAKPKPEDIQRLEMMKPRPEDLQLPDELIMQYQLMVEQDGENAWRDGDFLAEVVDEFATVYSPEQMRRVRARIIAQLADATGANRATMRNRECMARDFPPALRAQYAPLTFYQLRECRRAGERWQEWAEWALNNLPAPCHVIRKMIKNNGHLPPAWKEKWVRLGDLAYELSNDKTADQEVRQAAGLFYKLVTGEIEYEKDCTCAICRYARGEQPGAVPG